MVKNKLISFIQLLAHPLFIGFIVACVVLEESHYSFFPDNIVRDYYRYIKWNRVEIMKDDFSYSYCVGERSIENPILWYTNGRYYIFSENILAYYNGDDTAFLSRRDVFLYSSGIEPRIYFSKFKLYRRYYNQTFRNDISYPVVELIDSSHNMRLYKFRKPPEAFLLMFENTRSYDPKLAARFSNHPLISHSKEYYPSLLAIYKTTDVERMYNEAAECIENPQIDQDYPWF